MRPGEGVSSIEARSGDVTGTDGKVAAGSNAVGKLVGTDPGAGKLGTPAVGKLIGTDPGAGKLGTPAVGNGVGTRGVDRLVGMPPAGSKLVGNPAVGAVKIDGGRTTPGTRPPVTEDGYTGTADGGEGIDGTDVTAAGIEGAAPGIEGTPAAGIEGTAPGIEGTPVAGSGGTAPGIEGILVAGSGGAAPGTEGTPVVGSDGTPPGTEGTDPTPAVGSDGGSTSEGEIGKAAGFGGASGGTGMGAATGAATGGCETILTWRPKRPRRRKAPTASARSSALDRATTNATRIRRVSHVRAQGLDEGMIAVFAHWLVRLASVCLCLGLTAGWTTYYL